jgi:hypothetical protein
MLNRYNRYDGGPLALRMTCRGVERFGVIKKAPGCLATRPVPRFRSWQLKSYRADDQSYVCSPCRALLLSIARAEGLLKQARAGKGPLDEKSRDRVAKIGWDGVRSWPAVSAILAELGRSRVLAVPAAAMRSRRTAGQGSRHPTDRPKGGYSRQAALAAGVVRDSAFGRDRLMAWKWHPAGGSRADVSLCRGCGRWLLSGGTRTTEWHQPCLISALRTPEIRGYAGRYLLGRRAKVTPAQLARRMGPWPFPEQVRAGSNLRRDVGLAVRHYMGGDLQKTLAGELGLSRAAVTQAIARAMTLMPDPTVCNAQLRDLVERLAAAAVEEPSRRRVREEEAVAAMNQRRLRRSPAG